MKTHGRTTGADFRDIPAAGTDNHLSVRMRAYQTPVVENRLSPFQPTGHGLLNEYRIPECAF
jgi:hypothetical protein